MTTTARITLRWADRNHIGEPCRSSIEWSDDEESLRMLAAASDTLHAEADRLRKELAAAARIRAWRQSAEMVAAWLLALAGACFMLLGFIDTLQWIRARL